MGGGMVDGSRARRHEGWLSRGILALALLPLVACSIPKDPPGGTVALAPPPDDGPAPGDAWAPVPAADASGGPTVARQVQVGGWAIAAWSADDQEPFPLRVTATPASGGPVSVEARTTNPAYLLLGGDLDGNGQPEAWVWSVSTDGARRGALTGFEFTASDAYPVALPALSRAAAAGYGGGDRFAVQGDRLQRSFPLHDRQGRPTGETRTIDYGLEPAPGGGPRRLVELGHSTGAGTPAA